MRRPGRQSGLEQLCWGFPRSPGGTGPSGNVLRVQGRVWLCPVGAGPSPAVSSERSHPMTRPCLPPRVGTGLAAAWQLCCVSSETSGPLHRGWCRDPLATSSSSTRCRAMEPGRWGGSGVAKPGFGPQPCQPASSPGDLGLQGTRDGLVVRTVPALGGVLARPRPVPRPGQGVRGGGAISPGLWVLGQRVCKTQGERDRPAPAPCVGWEVTPRRCFRTERRPSGTWWSGSFGPRLQALHSQGSLRRDCFCGHCREQS